MKEVTLHLKHYLKEVDRRIFWICTAFVAALIFVNYSFGLNEWIMDQRKMIQYLCWYGVFLIAFLTPYVVTSAFGNLDLLRPARFPILLLIAPVLFAWKMSGMINIRVSQDALVNGYWNRVVYYPFKLLVIICGLYLIWLVFDRKHQPFYGTDLRNFHVRPYAWMLLIMVPLVAAASTQPDFLNMYPKLKNISYFTDQHPSPFYKLLYEISYGIDFVGIELFFRGFLILAFIKWAGRDSILPMAVFYCTIHFGKPLGECISSFFGGIVLGVVTYHTRTILGGLMVHLGIAWLMEIGGYFGNLLK